MKNDNKLLMCADYPYYRDSVDDWHDKLEKLKQLKINVVTCYIPWRHHLLNLESNKYDFKGNDINFPEKLIFPIKQRFRLLLYCGDRLCLNLRNY